jgi:hypothetical protein
VPDCSDQSLDVAVIEVGGRVEEIDGDAVGEAGRQLRSRCSPPEHGSSPTRRAVIAPSQSMAAIAVPLLVPCSMKRPVKSSAAEERARIPKVSYLMLSEDIVRTLSVAFAKRLAAPVFLRLFREPPALQD